MALLSTAKMHFSEDISRAFELHRHALTISHPMTKGDILRAAWMMAVGACDAYFSDAYADLVSRTLRARDLESHIEIPDRLNNLRIPVIAVIRQSTGGWRWRMAARELIENENVLSFRKIKDLFNAFFRPNHKLLSPATIENWIVHVDAKQRMFGVSRSDFSAMAGAQRDSSKNSAINKLAERFDLIFQRRHDCIHNCDRPKMAIQTIEASAAKKAIEDVEFFVCRCHEELSSEFQIYLTDLGFCGATRSQVLA